MDPSSAPEPVISLTGQDRLTQREQISTVLGRAQEKREPLRVRLPFTLYDHGAQRAYVFVRDAAWNLQLKSDQLTPEIIEQLIRTIGECMAAIARDGTEAVMQKLAPPLVEGVRDSETLDDGV